ncbi:hypothetical protein KIW84_022084 [Lathyrus oleraceus]|uniref:Uncharacterized protein n=1 Tax=Pisum sativum TaxID=3888 RepID=A0A9D5BAA5_PEA|nr:hypothetical protein KIW84_022084 [Pisum sativum]
MNHPLVTSPAHHAKETEKIPIQLLLPPEAVFSVNFTSHTLIFSDSSTTDNPEKENDTKVKNASAFYSGTNRKRGKEYHSRLKCDHYGKIGHVKEKSFEIVGYPTSWESRRTQRKELNKLGGKQVTYFAEDAERKEFPKASTSEHALYGVHANAHETRLINLNIVSIG